MEIVSQATEDIYILTESHNLHKSLGLVCCQISMWDVNAYDYLNVLQMILAHTVHKILMPLKFSKIVWSKNIHKLCQKQFVIWQCSHPVASIVSRIVFGNTWAENTDGDTEGRKSSRKEAGHPDVTWLQSHSSACNQDTGKRAAALTGQAERTSQLPG